MTEIVLPRVAPQRTAQALPNADPRAFGASIGESAERLGNTLHQVDVQAREIALQHTADSEAAEFNKRFALYRTDHDQAEIDAKNTAAPGGADYADQLAKWRSERRDKLLEGISDGPVRRRAEAALQDFDGRAASGAITWAEGARVGKLVTDTEEGADIAANRVRRNGDPKSYVEELTHAHEAVAAMRVPDDVRHKLDRFYAAKVATGYINGLNDRDPKAAVTLIDAGTFDGVLSPEQIDQARGGAMVEVRRGEAQAAQLVAAQQKADREDVADIKANLSGGIDVDPMRIRTAIAAAEERGDKSTATELGISLVQTSTLKIAKAMTPVQRDAEIGRLAAVAKPSAVQQVQLNYLRSVKGSLDGQYNSDRAGFYTANGNPPPPLNLADRAAIHARKRWARTTGAPVLTNNETAEFREQARQSPSERLKVANQLAALGGRDAMVAARQVAPEDAMLSRLVLLRRGDRAATVNGGDARKANPALIDGAAGNDAREAFNARLGGATALMPQGDVAAAFEVARNLYADWAVLSRRQDYDERVFASFVHRAFGGTKDAQGHWQGGIGEHNGARVVLPPGATQGKFDTVIARMNWSPKDRNAPHWDDGHPMTPAEVRGFAPVARPDGTYEFHDRKGGVVTVSGGNTWRVDIAKLTARLP